MALNYYSTLFSSERTTQGTFIQGCFAPLSAIKLRGLQQDCFDVEVTRSLKSMSPLKAPNPDGFQACFFQNTWATTGPSITSLVKRVMFTGEIPTGLAEVLLVLVPKLEFTSTLAHFRPHQSLQRLIQNYYQAHY